MSDRIPYHDLLPAEQQALHAWLRGHRVEPERVPLDAQFELDAATGEWRIPVFVRHPDGGIRVDLATGDILRRIVRRRELRPLPWPRVGLRLVGPVTSITIAADVTSYVSGIEIAGQQLAVHHPGDGCPCDEQCVCGEDDCPGDCWMDGDGDVYRPTVTIDTGGLT